VETLAVLARVTLRQGCFCLPTTNGRGGGVDEVDNVLPPDRRVLQIIAFSALQCQHCTQQRRARDQVSGIS
jgi:hypothetical protein